MPSVFSFDNIVALAREFDDWGVLELAFGGGEPTLFPRFAELLRVIWRETGLCCNFTTNGLRLKNTDLLHELDGCYGQVQLSVYGEDDTFAIIDHLVEHRARFGLNYLVTPARVRSLEADVFIFADRGVRDILFLSYKGEDEALHLTADDCRRLDESLLRLHELLGDQVALKVDVCWGNRLRKTPRLFDSADCEANADFVSITSDKRVLGCSFASQPLADLSELREIYAHLQTQRIAAVTKGCSRLPGFGLRGRV